MAGRMDRLLDPLSPTQLFQHAVLLAQRGQITEAVGEIEQFLTLRPTVGPGWNVAGRLYMELGKTQKAVHAFHRCLAFPDCPSEVFENLADTYLRSGQPARAVRLFKSMKTEKCWDRELIGRAARDLGAKAQTLPAIAR